MNITIHRGAKQIGGCVTEISTEKTKLFIDLGADLTNDKEKSTSKIDINGLTAGNAENSSLLITHYHGDHIGRIPQILPDVNIYIGETAKEINLTKSRRLEKREPDAKKETEILEKAKTFKVAKKLQFGDIKVTPYLIDHSAFDAYSFLIEADGKRIFHTGDFRLHGLRGKKMFEKGFFEKYIRNIDYMICEGTNISRPEKVQTEFELQQEAAKLFKNPKHKYVFILCASTNIDRIFEFYHAYNKIFKEKRPFICDKYQRDIFEIVKNAHSKKTDFYNFDKIYDYRKSNVKLNNWMDNAGFCFLIRQNDWNKELLEKYFAKSPEESLIIYSMWKGYITESNKAKSKDLIEFLKPYPYEYLHTSGHADIEALKKVAESINPKHIIPIHTEKPEEFTNLFKNTLLLEDGKPFKIPD